MPILRRSRTYESFYQGDFESMEQVKDTDQQYNVQNRRKKIRDMLGVSTKTVHRLHEFARVG